MNDLIERYLACWNETDSAARRDLITKTWADEASYIDPLVDAQGHDAIDAAIAATQGQFPGHVFALVGRWTPIRRRPVQLGSRSRRRRATGDRLRRRVRRRRRAAGRGRRLPRQGAERRYS